MKKLIIVLLMFGIYSCTSITDLPRYTESTIVDFTKYSKEGFKITPENYNGEYESIGLIDIALFPRTRKVESSSHLEGTKENFIVQGLWVSEKLSADEIVQIAVDEVEKMGGDAIINFKIESSIKEYTEFNHYGLRVSGYAIKRH